ncbi:porin [Defluviimonas salinarum]|uniref:Porin n=1 Tax=Defluviimonas salinarum TaxID=2992147 RepID=A0ABT3J328_9RHOB|nr:porin [Defluviimonas salinarum]MCW3782073.1 porin [Defluviimonas salinarum]
MKKLLLASTALVGFAGAAAAEVSLSGYAEIGVRGGSGDFGTVTAIETQFHNDVVINFNFSGSTDNGLDFGGKVQLDDSNGSNPNGTPAFDDEAFFVSGTFGRVTLGETDGAFDWALSEIYSGTSLNDDHSTHAGAYWFTGLDGSYDNQIARYEYSFGDFGVAVSAENDDSGVGDAVWGLGGKWAGTFSGVDAAAGIAVQDNGTNTVWGLSGSVVMQQGFSLSAGYADLDGTAFHTSNGYTTVPLSDSWWGLGAAYTTGALTVGANYGAFDTDMGTVDGWGLVANYDLGGGAVAMAGYGSGDAASWNGGGKDTWSVGLGLSF